MNKKRAHFGYLGIVIGSAALLLALVHFWAGPFAPVSTFETSIAEKAASIRAATLQAIKGEEFRETAKSNWDADKITHTLTAVLGGLALIMAVLSFARHEPARVALGGAALGITAIVFQFVAMYAMALLVVILICAVLISLGIS